MRDRLDGCGRKTQSARGPVCLRLTNIGSTKQIHPPSEPCLETAENKGLLLTEQGILTHPTKLPPVRKVPLAGFRAFIRKSWRVVTDDERDSATHRDKIQEVVSTNVQLV